MVTCEPVKLMHSVGKKWMIPLLDTIDKNGDKGFNFLKEALEISSKVLSERLKELEKEELVVKETYQEENIERSKYSLSEKGEEFNQLLIKYKEFCVKYDEKLPCGKVDCANCEHLC